MTFIREPPVNQLITLSALAEGQNLAASTLHTTFYTQYDEGDPGSSTAVVITRISISHFGMNRRARTTRNDPQGLTEPIAAADSDSNSSQGY
jgi:hypothetical protein